ncbi:TPA: radical SAM protein [Candidatus Bathyarchaeota archaeon]|nr:radical SAM protein [Candidatus Bathyarchaeota archaeon]
MVDVLLIQPPFPPSGEVQARDVVLCPPLGLGYIASFLASRGFTVRILDCAILNMGVDEASLEVKRLEPKILGFSVATPGYKNALKIAGEAKKFNEEVATVFGGPHVTFAAEEAVKREEVDFVVRQEGEETMLELAEALLRRSRRIEEIEGLSYRRGNRAVHNPPRLLREDLDSLPFPERRSLPLRLYKVPASLITTRGCPYKCIFCSAGAMSGGKYRVRSPGNVLAEVKHMLTFMEPDFFFIADDTFTIIPERMRKLCKGFKELEVKWVCAARANLVNREMLKEMAESGCFSVQFGAESGSQRILNSIRKGITVDQVRKGVKWCAELGIKPVCSFMIPHPEDTKETIEETKRLMEELKGLGAQLFVSFTTPFPGTFLYDHAEELGVKFLTRDTDKFNLTTPVIETKNLSLEEIEEAFDELAAISIETFPKELDR